VATSRRPRIALTAGEPAGVGPELIARLAALDCAADLIVIADRGLIESRGADIGVRLDLHAWDSTHGPLADGTLGIIDVPLRVASVAGQLDRANAAYVLETQDLEVLREADPAMVAILFENLLKLMAVRVGNLRDSVH
jgi:4-hydroxythreonine-4-phosphate dehydrogenase